jgi:poly [ADP-ribose] polymerase
MTMAKVIEAHELVCVDIKTNHNKFYHIELFDNNDVLGKWGRCGYGNSSQEKLYPGIGRHGMQRKMSEKYAKGYKEIETIATDSGMSSGTVKTVSSSSLQKIAQEQIVSKHPLTQKLIAYLTKVNAHNIYEASGGKIEYSDSDGLLKTARGIITQNAIDQARDLLDKIGNKVNARKFKEDTTIELVENYLTIVPQHMGMGRFTVESFLPDVTAVQKQNDLLDSLSASFTAATTVKPKADGKKDDKAVEAPKVFDAKLELVEDGKVFDRIRKLYESTMNRVHSSYGTKIKSIYTVEIAPVVEAFEAKGKPLGNVMELWHGTKHCHVLSILKGGLIVPPNSSQYVTGRMFGNGVYFALQSSKSLNYATGYWGGTRGDRMFMFLCDVALGKYYVPSGSTSSSPPSGYHSYWAKPRQSGVMNDEIIVQKTYQCNLAYLLEF